MPIARKGDCHGQQCPMPAPSEFDLLCEQCGYRLEGLEGLGAEGVCPECGRPVAESLPGRRRGTPAQRAVRGRQLARTGPLLATVWQAVRSVRSPRVMWDEARVGHAADEQTKGTLLLYAATLVVGWILLMRVAQGGLGTLPPGAFYGAIGVMVIWLALNGLTWVEKTGIRTFGRMHGRRITPAVAMTIVAHASTGWLVGAALLTPAWLAGRWLPAAADEVALLRWELVYMLPVILPALAGLGGLLLFEVITWQGVMRLRYANRERPWESDRPAGAGPAPHSAGGEGGARVAP